jgi:hypothetical protein
VSPAPASPAPTPASPGPVPASPSPVPASCSAPSPPSGAVGTVAHVNLGGPAICGFAADPGAAAGAGAGAACLRRHNFRSSAAARVRNLLYSWRIACMLHTGAMLCTGAMFVQVAGSMHAYACIRELSCLKRMTLSIRDSEFITIKRE